MFKANIDDKLIYHYIESWMKSFANECSLFKLANDWDEFWRIYKEEPLLTLLATGLSRNDLKNDISILREYPVYSDGRYIGASDLFLNYYKDKLHFFIEAKYERARWETGFIDWSGENYEKFIKETEGQLNPYMNAERVSGIKSYSVILLFYVLDFDDQDEYLEYLQRAEKYSPKAGQFYETIKADNPEKSPYSKFGILEVVGQSKQF